MRYFQTHFRISSGYVWGTDHPGLSDEAHGRFYSEITRLFSEAGWTVTPAKGKHDCPTFSKGKTALYAHPMDLSGPCEHALVPEVKAILSKGTTFKFLHTDTYDELLDLTDDEVMERFRANAAEYDRLLTESFRTKRRNLYKDTSQMLFHLSGKIFIRTLEHNLAILTPDTVSFRFLCERFDALAASGAIVKAPGNPERFARTAKPGKTA